MKWYEKALSESKKEIIHSAIISITISFAFSLWYFLSGNGFEWTAIHPIDEPTLSVRLLSGLVFVSFGRILYELKFYYVLYFIFVVILKAKALYRDLKKILWYSLMFFTGFVVVPWIIDVLNTIVSFFYNIAMFLAYVSPPIGIFIILFLPSYYLFKSEG